ncbi:uncharacterized protein IL334_004666 [Kwoniella shivajii]|uniref:Transcription elongation factor Eaf N-terminal domain-containing protein n=1 Tax=Kwoniella shivajii TaxID=564305 RepID=A0ABZ1D2D1_9TREE|nr:hypothetical protein IL334_004666 [Kwoniella shivajii]
MTTNIPKGTFPLSFSSSLSSQWGNKKRRRDENEIVAFRYNFKPGSVNEQTPGRYDISAGIGNGGEVVFDTSGGQQVFDVREESSKPRECVLIYNDETKSFTLHPLPSTLHLTLNRATRNKAASISSSTNSTTSSISVPLSKPNTKQRGKHDGEESQNHDSFSSGDGRNEVSSLLDENVAAEDDTPRPKKKSHPSTIEPPPPPILPRATKSGKGLPRKKPMESAPIPVLSGPSSTTAKKSSKAKVTKKVTPKSIGRGKKVSTTKTIEPATPTKFKSAEYIEDSDEEIAASESIQGDAEGEEVDEFANLLGESLAQGDAYDNDDDDDEEEEEESDDDEGLGGARLVVGRSEPVLDDDGSEWI